MLLNVIFSLGSIILGCVCTFLFLKPRLTWQAQRNLDIQLQNEQAQKQLDTIKQDTAEALNKYEQVVNDIVNKKQELADLNTTFFTQVDDQANKIIANAQDRILLKSAELKTGYEQARQDYVNEYTTMLNELSEEYTKTVNNVNNSLLLKKQQLSNLEEELQQYQSSVAAAVEANKRALEMETQADFYKLNLTNEDIKEISQLRTCFNTLRNPEPLNKVIWKVYYEKPTTDLIGRVIGSGVHCGIYKITNTLNNMCYVGQSVNIADRWKQHIKRGIGADAPTRNKLYPAMMTIGVENFSFEIIEECNSNELNEREKFWTDYFKAQEFGYSVRKG